MKNSFEYIFDHIPCRVAPSESSCGHGSWPIHPAGDAFQEYYFSRLPEPQITRFEEHISTCKQCQNRLDQTAFFVDLMKEAIRNQTDAISGNIGPVDQRCTPIDSKRGHQNRPQISTKPNLHGIGGAQHSIHIPRCFSEDDLLAARGRLPVSNLITSRCLTALHQPNTSLDEIESIVSQDPGTIAHLVKVANSALLSSGTPIRSVARAIMQIGFERTKLHILGLSMRSSYGSPQLKEVWNHSIQVAERARKLAELSRVIRPEEACLAGLVHDIGCLVLVGLGRAYESSFAELRMRGIPPMEIEQRLCGSSHAHIGADLLDSWSFPADMVESVRHHHEPSASDLALTSLMFIAESWVENDEDVYDPIEHSLALHYLKLTAKDISSIRASSDADLVMLRFAAAV
jgi:putative nucleotidyltransferase with HDIG domain